MDVDNAKEFAKLGGIALLQQFLDSKDEELVQIVISTIANIASSGKEEKGKEEEKEGGERGDGGGRRGGRG